MNRTNTEAGRGASPPAQGGDSTPVMRTPRPARRDDADTLVDATLPELMRRALRSAASGSSRRPTPEVPAPSVVLPDSTQRRDTPDVVRPLRMPPPVPMPKALEREGGSRTVARPGEPPSGWPDADASPTGSVEPTIQDRSSKTSPPARYSAGTSEFQAAALEAYHRDEPLTTVLRAESVSAWSALGVLAALVVAGLLIAVFGRVEVMARGRGALHVAGGSQMVASQLEGAVAEIHSTPGQQVKAGDPILTMDSSTIRAELLHAQRHLTALRDRHAAEAAHAAQLLEKHKALIRLRSRYAEKRARIQQSEIRQLAREMQTIEALTEKGLVAARDARVMGGEVSLARRDHLAIRERIAESEIELSDIERAIAERAAERTQEVQNAKATVDAISLRIERSVIRASRPGRVEALLVGLGDFLVPGTRVARIAPSEQPRVALVFIPERDGAFLRVGMQARLEFDRLPLGEYGSVPAHVSHVSRDLASPEEVRAILGESTPVGPVIRVELKLKEGEKTRRLSRYFEPGTLVAARVPLHERPIITLALAPLRRLLE